MMVPHLFSSLTLPPVSLFPFFLVYRFKKKNWVPFIEPLELLDVNKIVMPTFGYLWVFRVNVGMTAKTTDFPVA